MSGADLRKAIAAQFERSFTGDTVEAIARMMERSNAEIRNAVLEEAQEQFRKEASNLSTPWAVNVLERLKSSAPDAPNVLPIAAPQCPRCGSYRLSCRDGHTWIIPTPKSSVALEQNTSGCPLVGCSIVHPHVHTISGPAW